MTDLSLGIDLGTSGIRSAVVNGAGEVVSTARGTYGPQDAAAIDATVWWNGVLECLTNQIAALCRDDVDPARIKRVGVDGTSGSMVLTDADLVPVTRALIYNSDGFKEEAAQIANLAPDPHITRGTSSALARALRLQAEDTGNAATHLLHQADFIGAKLMGQGGVSDHNNALKTGYDPEAEAWPDWYDALGLRLELLPNVLPAGAAAGPIAADVAAQFSLSANVVVHVGTTDSIAAFLAAAPLRLGMAVTSLGTTLAIKLLSAKRIDAPEIGLYSHRLGDGWLVGGASNTGGGALLQHFDAEQMVALSDKIDPATPSELDYYPLAKPGERFPVNDPHLAPRMGPRPADDVVYLHGLLEGIARVERQCYDAMVARGADWPETVFTAGGGARNATWTKIRERVLGMPLTSALEGEAAVGTARLIQSNA
ncbi:FGGY-family carbohydrate kinase [Jannaschia sp. CCS1]|uniref:FGGY-family carbohydrate kinase n=1 Tax=Jannaschia sp. (strain CCS1) TaxID=290400 RepID=UPI00006BFFE3|nr:FGGY-family carbohydrate kinase [Jannaschia sp. CCS1]ABD54313.1 xylose kinase putative [Jannaschia sp. CCS1]